MTHDFLNERTLPPAERPALTEACSCARADLASWSAQCGPIPASLANHIGACPACAALVRRVNTVHASMALLCTESVPAGLVQRANARALRMLRRAARASEAAQRALQTRPRPPLWQRVQYQGTRIVMSAAAALLIFVTRAGVTIGMERTRAAGEVLAEDHWNRHIDPNHEWLIRDDVV